jgi:hypothetical protein
VCRHESIDAERNANGDNQNYDQITTNINKGKHEPSHFTTLKEAGSPSIKSKAMSETPRPEDMKAAAKVVIEADEADVNYRAAAASYEERPRISITPIQDTSNYIDATAHESEVAPVENVDSSDLATQSIPFAHARPVGASASIQVGTLEDRLDLMTEMLIGIRRESSATNGRASPQFNVPPLPPRSQSRYDSQARSTMPANGAYARLRGNVEVQSSELELYVQERLTPIFARHRSSMKDYLGSMTQVKNLDPPEVCKDRHSVKDTASFPIIPRMSFSEDSENNSAQVSIKATVTEVLDAIHSSPRSSPGPSGQVTPKEVVQAELDALNSPPPAVAHLVSQKEDLDSLLHYVDAAVASFKHSVLQAKVHLSKSEGDDKPWPWYRNYPIYMSCVALGAGIVVGLKAATNSE